MTTTEPTENPVAARAAWYSELAEGYARLWSPVIRPMAEHLLGALPLAGASRVLDVGTGVGALMPAIRSAAPDASIVGVDPSRGMLRVARTAAPSSLAVMDAQALGLRSASFDVAVMAFVLFHLPEPVRGLAEVGRVLRPGGALGVVTWGDRPGFRASDAWDGALEACGAGPDPFDAVDQHDLMDTPAKLAALLERSGFVAIRAWSERFPHRWDAESLIAARVGFGSYRRRLDTLDAETRADCLRRVRARLADMDPGDFLFRPEIVFAIGQRSADCRPRDEETYGVNES